jgi:hypothetical protein
MTLQLLSLRPRHPWLNYSNPFPARVGPSSAVVGLPAGLWVTMLVAAWVLFGLVGHDPWKADEAHTFGIVIDYLRHGDWVVPTLAGEPFVEKPPLFYIVSAASAHLFGGLLPLHDAARLATGFFVGIALLFLGLTARELYGRGYAAACVVIFISCLGTFVRLHQIITDVALLAGMAMGVYGPTVTLGCRRGYRHRGGMRVFRQRLAWSGLTRRDLVAAAALPCVAHAPLLCSPGHRGAHCHGPGGDLDARAVCAGSRALP